MENTDVLIIWWWPSGSSLAIMLRKYWHSVRIIDKFDFPRHTIWESLLPIVTSEYMRVIWLEDELKKCGFPKKYGTTFVWWNSRKPWNLFFDKRLETDQLSFNFEEKTKILSWDYTHSYQVNRYYLDKLFIDKAVKDWTTFHKNTKIKDIILENDIVKWVVLENWEKIFSKFIVDASWQDALLWSKFWIRRFNKELGFSAIYTYFKDFNFIDNFLSEHTQYIVSVDIGWVWFIYIWKWIVSVWLVSNKKNLTQEDFFITMNSYKELSCIFREDTIQVDYLWNEKKEFYRARNWSYFNDRIYWRNYLMIWDAAWFVDPVLSWGMSIALMSWIVSSSYINKFLKWADISIFEKYQKIIFHDVNNYFELAKYWYGNNKTLDSWFWRAKNILWFDISNKFNKRAFTFLASWGYYTRDNLDDSNEVRIGDYAYDFEDIDEIKHMISEEDINYLKVKDSISRINTNIDEKDYKEIFLFIFRQLDFLLKSISRIDKDLFRFYREVFLINKINFIKFFFKEENYLDIRQSLSDWKISNHMLLALISYTIFILHHKDVQNFSFEYISSFEIKLPKKTVIYNNIIIDYSWLDKKRVSCIGFLNNSLFLDWRFIEESTIKVLYDNYLG